MIRTRTLLPVVLLSLGSLMAPLAGCGPAAKGTGPAIPAAPADPLAVFPADTGFVAGVSVAKVKATKIWKLLEPKIMTGEVKQMTEQLNTTCGLDPMRDIEEVTISLDSHMNGDNALLLVKGKWNAEQVSKCASGIGLNVATDGPLVRYGKGSDTMVGFWTAPDTLLFAAKDGGLARLTAAASHTSSMVTNKDIMELVGHADRKATLWGAGTFTAMGEKNPLAETVDGKEKPSSTWFTVELTSTFAANGAIRFATADGAKSAVGEWSQALDGMKQQPMVGSFLQTAKIAPEGMDVNLSLTLDEQAVGMLTQQVSMGLGMMGGD